jgi:thymidylate synthase ThyX
MLKREIPGTKLFIIDDLQAEDLAMLQALYSRSAESVETHLEKVAKAGSGKFMGTFYVGYNHKSIADCGTTTMFIEGVSMFVAKAIQDWPLYSGQETSTRFIDMGKQRIVDPVGTDKSGELLQAWMTFYRSNQDRVADTVRQRYPRRDGEEEKKYEAAVKARTFDVLRGFLPSGITTQLSWHTNLRQAGDHLNLLAKHPAAEVRQIAETLQGMFREQYVSSGDFGQAGVSAVTDKSSEDRKEREAWNAMMAERYTYGLNSQAPSFEDSSTVHFKHSILFGALAHYKEALSKRPRGCVIPHLLTDLGQVSFAFLLDFGSFRDIQRHRNGVCRMPLLTTEYGFEPWYLDQLDPELQSEAKDLIAFLSGAASTVTQDPIERQYYIPMGFRVQNQVTYGLPAAVYVMELRSNKTVHPTLRRVIHGMIAKFREKFPDFTLHADMDVDDWSVRRGGQTIQAK